MRLSIFNRLFASGGGGGRTWRSKRSGGYGNELGGRMLISTMSMVEASPPWLMLPPGRESRGDIRFNFYIPAEDRKQSYGGAFPFEADKMRFVGSSHGWLALFNDRTKHLFLTNPVSGRCIDLPSTDKTVSRVILSCSPDATGDECRAVMRFVTPSNETPAADTLAAYLPAMSLGPPESLAFCCLSNGRNRSAAWTPIISTYRAYGDFLCSGKGYLFCLTTNYSPKTQRDGFSRCNLPNLSDVEVWDLSDPECARIKSRHSLNEMPQLVRDSSGVSERRYLLFSEQLDQLYLVRRHMIERVQVRDEVGEFVKDIYYFNRKAWDNSYPYKTVRFDVHMIEEGKLLMDDKVALDNVAIFIGVNHGLVMEGAGQFGLKSNSIYFTDDTIHTPPDKRDADVERGHWHIFVPPKSKWVKPPSSVYYGGHDIGIFDCNDGTFSRCYFPIDPPSFKRVDPPPLWFTPDNLSS